MSKREVKIFITGDASGYKRAAADAGGASDRLGSKLTSLVGGVAVGAFFADAISQASNLEESLSKAKNVFGDSFGEIQKAAEGASRAVGLAQQDYLAAAAGFGNLLSAQGAGQFDNNMISQMSQQLVTLAADLSSFNNTSVEDAVAALTSGISGETEPLKRYGIILSDTRLKAEALSLGLVQSAGQQVKVQKKTQKFEKAQQKAAQALKKYGENSAEHQQASLEMAAALEDVDAAASSIPGTLDPAIKAQAALSLIQKDGALAAGDFSETSDGFANSMKIFKATVDDAKASLAIGLLPTLSLFLQGLTALGPEGMKVVIMLAGAVGMAWAFGQVTGAVNGTLSIFGVFMKHPLIAGGVLVLAGIALLITKWDEVTAAVQRAIDKMREATEFILGPLRGPAQAIGGLFGYESPRDQLDRIRRERENPAPAPSWDELRSRYGGTSSGARSNPSTAPMGRAREQRALGGFVGAGMPYLVGERGPELFVPAMSGAVVAHGAGMGAPVYITVNPAPGMNEVELARAVAREQQRLQRAKGVGVAP